MDRKASLSTTASGAKTGRWSSAWASCSRRTSASMASGTGACRRRRRGRSLSSLRGFGPSRATPRASGLPRHTRRSRRARQTGCSRGHHLGQHRCGPVTLPDCLVVVHDLPLVAAGTWVSAVVRGGAATSWEVLSSVRIQPPLGIRVVRVPGTRRRASVCLMSPVESAEMGGTWPPWTGVVGTAGLRTQLAIELSARIEE